MHGKSAISVKEMVGESHHPFIYSANRKPSGPVQDSHPRQSAGQNSPEKKPLASSQ
ncbi:hypothetical protein SLEP1_g29855 [Rubroshorea leprosula]|uniref:Uncharacterized protein n=1 Tax=Rubroshorea leprosula TaxID=152421 RepID=A0AAV5JYA3_9ROSI|nr:hypothetical protein SLEP1_g29855 [Rubroshorea leprosula]